MSSSKLALITGGNRGIGLAIANSLKAAGADVIVTYRTGSAPSGFKAVQMDVTQTDSVEKAFAEIEEKFGTPEIIVANAGITKDMLVMRMTDDDFLDVVNANLAGAFRVARRATKGLLKIKKGKTRSIKCFPKPSEASLGNSQGRLSMAITVIASL